MEKRIIVFLLFLAFAANASGISYRNVNIVENSPREGQVFNIGEPFVIDYDANIEMRGIFLYIQFSDIPGSRSLDLLSDDFNVPRKSYRKEIDSSAFPPGNAALIFNVDYTDQNINHTISYIRHVSFNPATQPGDSNVAARIVRVLPQAVYPNGWATFVMLVFPNKSFPGIILRETIPEGLDYTETAFVRPSAEGTTPLYQGKNFKMVVRKREGIPISSVSYTIRVGDLAPDTMLTIDGNWSVEGEDGITMGDKNVRVGGFRIPGCPMTDQELLGFITKWAREEITNNQILQVIERWRTCQS